MKYLGTLAKENGCATSFMQGSPRRSFRCDAISSVAGFDSYFGMEDVPPTGHILEPHPLGAWDYDLLMFAAGLFARTPKPFLGFVFTLSTHGPFEMSDPRWHIRPPDSVLNKYLNCVAYSDWALGRFVEKAKEAGWFQDTVFVFVADHTCGRFVRGDDRLSFVSVPLLVIAPGLEPGVRQTLGSQVDLIPTIMDLAGWGGTHATLGRSLVEKTDAPRFVLAAVGGMEIWIEDAGWICHNRHSILDSAAWASGADFALMELRCKAAVQTVSHVLARNRVFAAAGP
jgi:phosphoglycerol transferase MdoB-like AlkP superfamily enzyme